MLSAPVRRSKSLSNPKRIEPGSTIGIVGGGQLGRMTAQAASRLGYKTHVFTPEKDAPASQVAGRKTVADYEDGRALGHFADAVDVVTFEFENVPWRCLEILARHVVVRPNPKVLEICQDRLPEKDFVNACGVGTAPYAAVDDLKDLERALSRIGTPAVLKTRRFGYDGKGQAKIADPAGAAAAWRSIERNPAILEGFVKFRREISVIVARGVDGSMATYDPVENRHVDHILDTTVAPAPIPLRTARAATRAATRIAENIGLIGLIAVEMFEAPGGAILVNELAPRPHNSGHWTIEGAETSQFEQLVRAVTGLPLGPTTRRGNALMKNLVGSEIEAWPSLVAEPGFHVHLYGKAEARAGRKVGHVTRLYPFDKKPQHADIHLGAKDRRARKDAS